MFFKETESWNWQSTAIGKKKQRCFLALMLKDMATFFPFFLAPQKEFLKIQTQPNCSRQKNNPVFVPVCLCFFLKSVKTVGNRLV